MGNSSPRQPLFELLEAVAYAARHDDAVVVVRDGKVLIAQPLAVASTGY